MAENKIEGGAVIWARQTIESDIFFYKPAVWFKVWFYIVSRVAHKDSRLFARGEGLITYEEIMAKTKASKAQVHKCIKYLEKENMLGFKRTTRGMVRTVNKYAYFQSLKNYTDNPKTTRGTTTGQLADNCGVLPINKNVKKVKNVKEEDNDYVIEENLTAFGNEEINWVLREFEKQLGFPSKGKKLQDRRMAKHLLRELSKEQISYMLKYCATNEYAPRIGSVEKLWYKRGDIIAALKAKKSKPNNSIAFIS